MATKKAAAKKAPTKPVPTSKLAPEEIEEEMIEEEAHEEIELELYRVVPESPRIKAMIYGEPGCGKTSLAATAQDHDDMAPILFANIEGGLLSVSHRKDMHAVDIQNTASLYALYRKLKHKEDDFGEINTIVIDNVSELQTLNLDEIVQEAMGSGKAKDRNRESEDEIWQEDYGQSTVQLGRVLRWFKNLDINVIVTAHAKFVYPPSGKNNRQGVQEQDPVAVLPMLTQKLCKSVMGMVDFCWYMQYEPESNERLLLTRPDGIYQAKTRGHKFAKALGPVVKNPSMPDLYDLLVKSQRGTK